MADTGGDDLSALPTPTNLAEWLQNLDLFQYYDNFVNSGISTLEHCTSLDSHFLNDIGVTLLGHRKRILEHVPLLNVEKYHEERNKAKTLTSSPSNTLAQQMANAGAEILRERERNSLFNLRTGSFTSTKPESLELADVPEMSPPPPALCPGAAAAKTTMDLPPSYEDVTKQPHTKTNFPVPAKRKPRPVPKPRTTVRKHSSSSQEGDTLNKTWSGMPASPSPMSPMSVSISGVTMGETEEFTDRSANNSAYGTVAFGFEQNSVNKIGNNDDEIYMNYEASETTKNKSKIQQQQQHLQVNDTETTYEPIWFKGNKENCVSNSESLGYVNTPRTDSDLLAFSPGAPPTKTEYIETNFDDDDSIYQNVEVSNSGALKNTSSTFPGMAATPISNNNNTKYMTDPNTNSSNILGTDLDMFFPDVSSISSSSETPTSTLKSDQSFNEFSTQKSYEGDNSFELPPPSFPPPPLPPTGPPTDDEDDDISSFDPLVSPKPKNSSFKTPFPVVPARKGSNVSNDSASQYVNLGSGEMQKSSFSESFNPGMGFTPDKKPWAVPNNIPISPSEFTNFNDPKISVTQKTPLKNIKLPSMTTPGPDPFQDQDPFQEFEAACDEFNQVRSQTEAHNSDPNSSLGVYEFDEITPCTGADGGADDFDPFGLMHDKGSGAGVYGSLSDVPPPPHWDTAVRGQDRVYSVAQGLSKYKLMFNSFTPTYDLR